MDDRLIEDVKAANTVEDVIGEVFELVDGRGRYRKTRKHDSLVIDIREQYYVWNSQGEGGDVIDWVQRHQTNGDFVEAVRWLVRRGGLDEGRLENSGGDPAARAAARRQSDALGVAARWFAGTLAQSPDAAVYLERRRVRGETIQRAALGYTGDMAGLRGELQMHGVDLGSDVAAALLAIPKGMICYPHVLGGRARYLTFRSIRDKRHYNLKADLVGERQVYFNWHWHSQAQRVVIVEGQMDAISLGQMGVAAVALAGVSGDGQRLTKSLEGAGAVWIGLDSDATEQAMSLAHQLGPTTRMIAGWPEGKDANEWLIAMIAAGMTDEEIKGRLGDLLDTAQPYVLRLAYEAGRRRRGSPEWEVAVKNVALVAGQMEPLQQAMFIDGIAKNMGAGLRDTKRMLRAARELMDGAAAEPDEVSPVTIETLGGRNEDLLPDGWLIEPIWRGGDSDHYLFAIRQGEGGEVTVARGVDVNGYRFEPPGLSDLVRRGVVLLPSGLGEVQTVGALVERIRTFIYAYLDIDRVYLDLAAFYVLFTWLYDAFPTVAYLRALGDWGTGKSRFLRTIGVLCYRPMLTSGASTVSPIFRIIERWRGTLIIDEADFGMSDTEADIIKIFNTGYESGTMLLRAGSERSDYEPEAFNVFGPKVIATRKKFVDQALEARCLTKITMQTTRMDIPLILESEFYDEATAIRNDLLAFRMRHWRREVKVDYSGIDRNLPMRLNQVTLPMRTIIPAGDPALERLQNFVLAYHQQLLADTQMSLESKVLEVILEVTTAEPDGVDGDGRPEWGGMRLMSIAQRVNAMIDEENAGGDEGDDEGEGGASKTWRRVQPRKIGHLVRNKLNLQTERRSDSSRAYQVVYEPERLAVLAGRFGLAWQPGA